MRYTTCRRSLHLLSRFTACAKPLRRHSGSRVHRTGCISGFILSVILDTVLHPAHRRAGDSVIVQSDGNRRSLSGVVKRARMTHPNHSSAHRVKSRKGEKPGWHSYRHTGLLPPPPPMLTAAPPRSLVQRFVAWWQARFALPSLPKRPVERGDLGRFQALGRVIEMHGDAVTAFGHGLRAHPHADPTTPVRQHPAQAPTCPPPE